MQITTHTSDILNKALARERLSLEEGVRLFEEADLEALQVAADTIRQRRHPDGHEPPRITHGASPGWIVLRGLRSGPCR